MITGVKTTSDQFTLLNKDPKFNSKEKIPKKASISSSFPSNPYKNFLPQLSNLTQTSIFFQEGELSEENLASKIQEKVNALRNYAISNMSN